MARNIRRHETTEERAAVIADELRALAKREGLEVDATFLVHTALTLASCYVDTEAQTRELMGTTTELDAPEVPESSRVISSEFIRQSIETPTRRTTAEDAIAYYRGESAMRNWVSASEPAHGGLLFDLVVDGKRYPVQPVDQFITAPGVPDETRI